MSTEIQPCQPSSLDSSIDEILSAAHRAQLVRLCVAVTGDSSAGEDLAQEALLEAWRNRHKLTDPAGADRWLASIARNVCRRWLRRRSRDVAAVQPIDPDAEPVDRVTAVSADAFEVRQVLADALATLPSVTRQVLLAQYIQDATHTEIAPQVGLSPAAVAMRASRGRSALKQLLEVQLNDIAEPPTQWRPLPHGWVPTETLCATCGVATLVMRHYRRRGEVSFRCARCHPQRADLSHHYALDVPIFGRLFADLGLPSVALNRATSWSWQYFQAAADRGEAACTRCGRQVPLRTASDGGKAGRTSYIECSHCRHTVSTSAFGTALAAPATRDFRKRHPRTRIVRIQETRYRGIPTQRIVLGDSSGQATLEISLASANLRFLHALTSSSAER